MSQLQIPVLNAVLPQGLPQIKNLDPQAPPEPNNKPFVIIHTVDIAKNDLINFKAYGNVILYHYDVEGNIPVSNLATFDYLFIDLRDKKARAYYDNNDFANYNVIAYISFIQQYDSYIESLGANNILSKFPDKTHYKSQYDFSLLQKPTDAPTNTCLSCINYSSSFLDSVRRQ